MKIIPNTVKITLVLLGIVAVIWIVFGIAVVARLHPAFPVEPFFRWGIGSIAILAGLVMARLAVLLWKRKKFAWWLVLIGMSLFAMATFLDQIGWVDLLVLAITVVPIVLLIRDRQWFLQPGKPKIVECEEE